MPHDILNKTDSVVGRHATGHLINATGHLINATGHLNTTGHPYVRA